MSIRYYRKNFPVVNDIIVAKITEISNDVGIYAECIEYPNLRLFISPTEISKRRVNAHKFFSKDKLYPVITLVVDSNKSIIDVSYLKMKEADRTRYSEKFSIIQKIYKLGLEASEFYSSFFKIDIDQAMNIVFDRTIWNIFDDTPSDITFDTTSPDTPETSLLYVTMESKIQDINDLYISILEDPSKLFRGRICDIYKTQFIQHIKKRIKISDIVLTSEITLLCLQDSAVERIKNTLTFGIDPKIQIRYISSPRYEIITNDYSKSVAEELMNKTISTIKNNCEIYGVKFVKNSELCVLKEKTCVFN